MLINLAALTSAIRKYASLSAPRFLVTSLTQSQIATVEGDRFGYTAKIANIDTETPLFILIENPSGSGVNVGFENRILKSIAGGIVSYEVLWDYDVSLATKTPINTFNDNNLYRGAKDGLLEVSILNPVTLTDRVYNITGAANITSEGIQRDIDSIPTSGVGNNTSGAVSSAAGFRVYGQGTGALIKIVSDVNDNQIINGYEWIEAPVSL